MRRQIQVTGGGSVGHFRGLPPTSLQLHRGACVLWWCTVGGRGVDRRGRREGRLVEGKQRSDLPFLSVCPQLRAGTARSALPADNQMFKSGWGTTTVERRASRKAAPTRAYLSGYHQVLHEIKMSALIHDQSSTQAMEPQPVRSVCQLGAAPVGGGRRSCHCTPELALMNRSAFSLSIRP